MIEFINKVANLIMFLFCLWAVLEKHCKTHLIGTLALSLVAMSTLMNIIRPESVGLVEAHFEVSVNVVVALAVIWYWVRWRKMYCNVTKDDHAPD